MEEIGFTSNRHPNTSIRYVYAPVDHHWNENVVILTKSSSLAALKVVKMTTFSAASDENFIKMTTFPFQWLTGKVSSKAHS